MLPEEQSLLVIRDCGQNSHGSEDCRLGCHALVSVSAVCYTLLEDSSVSLLSLLIRVALG